MATGWKAIVERVATRSGLSRSIAKMKAPSTAILAYHNIVPTGEVVGGDASLHVDQRTFADQLDFLTEWADVVGLGALGAPDESTPSRLRVVVTFDDAYLGAVTAGVEELRLRELPATVFVAPGLLGQPSFWWDALAPQGARPLSSGVRRHALDVLAGRQAAILEWASKEGLGVHDVPEHARPSRQDTLLARSRYERLTLGAHTWGHPNLARLGPEEASDELRRSQEWVASHAPHSLDWLAYPYGLRSDDTVRLAQDHFEGALLIDGGLARARGRELPRHALPRINVPRGLTLDGLALRLAGLLG